MEINYIPIKFKLYAKKHKLTTTMMAIYIVWLTLISLLFHTDPTFQYHSDVIDIFLCIVTFLISIVYLVILTYLTFKYRHDNEKKLAYNIPKYIIIFLTVLFFYLIPF